MSLKADQVGSRQRSNEERSGESVVYSFFQKWENPLRAGRVRLFFRKRCPVQKPARVYFYVGTPLKALIGSAAVSRIDRVSREEALLLTEKGCISPEELLRYIAHNSSVGVIWIEDFQFFDESIPASTLLAEIGLSPPQNFQKISAEDEAAIRKLINVA